MEIPWWAWIIIGIPMIIFSSVLDMALFVVVGVIVTVVGTAKLVHHIVLKPKPVEGPVPKKFCPRCFVRLPMNAKQCTVCGRKL